MKFKSILCDVMIIIVLTLILEVYFVYNYHPNRLEYNIVCFEYHLKILIINFIIGYSYSKLCSKFCKINFIFNVTNLKKTFFCTLIVGLICMILYNKLIMLLLAEHNDIIGNIYVAMLPSLNYLSILIGRKLGSSA